MTLSCILFDELTVLQYFVVSHIICKTVSCREFRLNKFRQIRIQSPNKIRNLLFLSQLDYLRLFVVIVKQFADANSKRLNRLSFPSRLTDLSQLNQYID